MDIGYIKELKNDAATGLMIEYNYADNYKIRIIYKGEGIVYHDIQLDRATIIDIQIRNGSIFESSIVKWDNDDPISEQEKKIIVERLVLYFKKYQKIEPIVRE